MSDENSDYEVGYGRPPKSGQFKKGRSGNPKGRPKGARGLKTDLKAEMNEAVTITENGRPRKISKQRLIIKQLVNNAAKGGDRAIAKAIDVNLAVLGPEDEPLKGTVAISRDDQAVLDEYVKRNAGRSSDET